jgi:coenzyme F420-reducing hydrogenase alpha subunit
MFSLICFFLSTFPSLITIQCAFAPRGAATVPTPLAFLGQVLGSHFSILAVDENIGAFEASLMGTPVERANEPVEILRTLHSFDPCLACSTHVMSEDGEELINVKVR